MWQHIVPDRSFAGLLELRIDEVAVFRLEGAEALGATKGRHPSGLSPR